MAYIDFLDFS